MCIAIRLFLYDPQTHSTDVSQRFQVKDSEMTQSSLMAKKKKTTANFHYMQKLDKHHRKLIISEKNFLFGFLF